MKNFYLKLLVVFLIFSSCSKEQGCTDVNALNYSPTAEVDDLSCTYPTKLRIEFVRCSSFPSVDDNGSPWDPLSNPDTFLRIEDDNNNIIYQSGVFLDNNLGYDVVQIDPILTVDNLNQNLTVLLYDSDPQFDQYMGLTVINLNTYTDPIFGDLYPYSIESSYGGFTFELSGLVWE